MTNSERQRYRVKLTQLGRRLSNDLINLREATLQAKGGEASGSLSNAPLHLADLGTEAFEQEVALGLMETKADMLHEISDALDRVEQGAYGDCQECGEEIARQRLDALPFTRLCIDCARQTERNGLS